jgi:hypothetical protein
MKLTKIAFILLIGTILIFSIWNKVLLDRCQKRLKQHGGVIAEMKNSAFQIRNAIIKAQTAALKHLGKTIRFEYIKKIYPENSPFPPGKKYPKLLLIFSELGCNVCQDEETRFAIKVAEEYGKDYVKAIIHADTPRYARNYIRMNQVNFPVFFCGNETFLNLNEIKNTPMILLVDKSNKVISSHFPIPGHPEYSQAFHLFCYQYFNKNR